ncbi:MAG: thiaminase II [Nitrospirales bacterium]|nr:thiaminase II [Nitrospirales bacterium]
MTWTESVRRANKPIWDAQFVHPFVMALGKGTLPLRKFKYYILQDARFLEELARVFAAGAQRATDPETARRFAQLVDETITVERGLHERYGKLWNLTPKAMRRTPLAPTNYAYTRHMKSVALQGTVAAITIVALPCAWIYCVIGQHLLKNGAPSEKHPYRDWLMMYASPEFAAVAEWMRTIVDGEVMSAGREEKAFLAELFRTSSRYEWMFWEMAWREEQWPV